MHPVKSSVILYKRFSSKLPSASLGPAALAAFRGPGSLYFHQRLSHALLCVRQVHMGQIHLKWLQWEEKNKGLYGSQPQAYDPLGARVCNGWVCDETCHLEFQCHTSLEESKRGFVQQTKANTNIKENFIIPAGGFQFQLNPADGCSDGRLRAQGVGVIGVKCLA